VTFQRPSNAQKPLPTPIPTPFQPWCQRLPTAFQRWVSNPPHPLSVGSAQRGLGRWRIQALKGREKEGRPDRPRLTTHTGNRESSIGRSRPPGHAVADQADCGRSRERGARVTVTHRVSERNNLLLPATDPATCLANAVTSVAHPLPGAGECVTSYRQGIEPAAKHLSTPCVQGSDGHGEGTSARALLLMDLTLEDRKTRARGDRRNGSAGATNIRLINGLAGGILKRKGGGRKLASRRLPYLPRLFRGRSQTPVAHLQHSNSPPNFGGPAPKTPGSGHD